ncbi:MAG: acyltransferase family protein [Patescibacteria group bacterium]
MQRSEDLGVTAAGGEGRHDFADLVKGFGIFLVVWGHTMVPRSVYIYSFHMPLFFFISGYLHRERPLGGFVVHKLNRLYVPYAVFSLLSWLFYLGDLLLRHEQNLAAGHLVKLVSVISGTARNGGNDSIWFLPCLLVVGVLHLALARLGRPRFILPAAAALSVLGYALGVNRFLLPFKIDVALLALPFYALGHLCRRGDLPARLDRLRPAPLAAALIAAEILHVATASLNVRVAGIQKVAMISNTVGDYFLFYLSALAGVAVFVTLGYKIGRLRWLNYLGINSLLLLACHKPLLYLLARAARGLNLFDPHAPPFGFLMSLLVTASVMPLARPCNKHLPWLVGKGSLFAPRASARAANEREGNDIT